MNARESYAPPAAVVAEMWRLEQLMLDALLEEQDCHAHAQGWGQ